MYTLRAEHGWVARTDDDTWGGQGDTEEAAVAALVASIERTWEAPVLREVLSERVRQRLKHGDQSHLPDGTAPGGRLARGLVQYVDQPFHLADNHELAAAAKRRCKEASQNEGGDGSITFEHILTEEFFEAVAESDPDRLYGELVQVAAVAVQWAEAIRARA